MRFIFVCGGVISGLGKGITTASLGLLLKNEGFSVTAVKIDPYVSIDAGTMRPQEHGEVFVTKDGGEIDQDLGNYERFLHEDFSKDHNITTGKIYQQVIENERHFVYEGRDAEMIPDVINEIKRRILTIAKGKDFAMVEIGGTVGDIENMPFLIAAREIGREHKSAYVMVSYLPFLSTVGEYKTKPTQHAVMQLRREGITPDFIFTRSRDMVGEGRIEIIVKRCFVDRKRVFQLPDVSSIYQVPANLVKQGSMKSVMDFFGLKKRRRGEGRMVKKWQDYVDYQKRNGLPMVKLALVGKYVKSGNHNHNDAYVSVLEALGYAGFTNQVKIDLEMISAESLNEENYKEKLKGFVGIVVPQGWGARGMEGKLWAIRYAREKKVPYLGLCYGMQMACVEFARNVLKLKGANSEEVDKKTDYPVIHIMPDQAKYLAKKQYGGTIRLGSWPCKLMRGSQLESLYKRSGRKKNLPWIENGDKEGVVRERHRHRYEFNNCYKKKFEKKGLVFSGLSPDGKLVEAIELKDHPFFIGTQFHPEYISRLLTPHPLFVGLVAAAKKKVRLK